MRRDLLSRLSQMEANSHQRYGAFGEAARFGPLLAVQVGPNLPLNTAWLDGQAVPSNDDLAAFEAFSWAHDQPPTIHLLSHQASALLTRLGRRGYALSGVLHVYTHELQAVPIPTGTDWQVEEVQDAALWASVSSQGFGPGAEEIMPLVARASGTRLFIAFLNDIPVGSAALSVLEGMAAFHGTSTLPQWRRQGVQAALLLHRLRLSREAGADLASVFVTPGSSSERQVQRVGFHLSGARLTFTLRQPPARR